MAKHYPVTLTCQGCGTARAVPTSRAWYAFVKRHKFHLCLDGRERQQG